MDTPDGREDWFLHFQNQGPYGRVVHLEPMIWKNDWPVIGADPDGDGIGQPVLTHRKPAVPGPPAPRATPATSDEFGAGALGPQWQWATNPQLGWAFPMGGALRLYAVPRPDSAGLNLWHGAQPAAAKAARAGVHGHGPAHVRAARRGRASGPRGDGP